MRLRKKSLLSLSIALGMVLLTGCKVKIPKVEVDEKYKLTCTATVSNDVISNGVDSGAAVEITVNAAGGDGPYHIVGQVGTFASTTTLSRSYSNTSTDDVVVEDFVYVGDTVGLSQQCDFSVTVHPEPVVPDPTLAVDAQPGLTVAHDASITVTATATELGADPDYAFEFTESGINIVQNDNVATFSVSDDSAHSFDVVVKASGDSKEASLTISLSFTKAAPTELTCNITHSSGTLFKGSEVTFTVTSTTGETMKITSGSFGTNSTVNSNTDGVAKVTYSSSGSKMISIQAKDKNSDAVCSSTLTDMVTIRTPMSCVALTDDVTYYQWTGSRYYDGYYYNTILTEAAVSGYYTGTAKVKSVTVKDGTSTGLAWTFPSYPLRREVGLETTGVHRLILKVEDGSGQTAECTTEPLYVYPLYYY